MEQQPEQARVRGERQGPEQHGLVHKDEENSLAVPRNIVRMQRG